MEEGELPLEVLNGRPGYINFLDALNSWQLVKELKAATGLASAASFKHVSPAGAAVGLPLSDTLKKVYFVDDIEGELSPIACAYARARGADRMSSYGDFVALSDTCDATTALLLKREVSDGVIAPDYTPEALEILRAKRKGTYNVIRIDPSYRPSPLERKQVFGITFEQGRNEIDLNDPALFTNIPTQHKTFTDEARRTRNRKRHDASETEQRTEHRILGRKTAKLVEFASPRHAFCNTHQDEQCTGRNTVSHEQHEHCREHSLGTAKHGCHG